MTLPLRITTADTSNALTSGAQNVEVKSSFKPKEPIMIHIEFEDAHVDEVITYRVTDQDGTVVREGSTTALRLTGDDDPHGHRYIPVVSGDDTALEAGEYTTEFLVKDHVIKTIDFKIE
jgi:hypothetical protein